MTTAEHINQTAELAAAQLSAKRPHNDAWRLSRSGKPLSSWRLSK